MHDMWTTCTYAPIPPPVWANKNEWAYLHVVRPVRDCCLKQLNIQGQDFHIRNIKFSLKLSILPLGFY